MKPKWRCGICSLTWEVIPGDAVLLNRLGRGHNRVYRFADGTIHSLHRIHPVRAQHGFHKTKKDGCELCFPPPPEPPVVVAALAEAPQLQEIIKTPEIEEEEAPTSMAAAFRKFRNS